MVVGVTSYLCVQYILFDQESQVAPDILYHPTTKNKSRFWTKQSK